MKLLFALFLLSIPLLVPLSGCGSSRCTSVSAFGNLGPEINSPFDDYAPVLQDSGTIIFTSNRDIPGTGGLRQQFADSRPAHLFSSMRLSERWDEAFLYQLAPGAEGREEATIAWAPQGDPFGIIAYFCGCDRPAGIGGCDLYAVTEGDAAAVINLGPIINSTMWESQPFVTADGQQLWFASNRPGGIGGYDLYVAERQPGGTWGEPRNAGPVVNSPNDELSPFVDPSTGTLYFASRTADHGLDLFQQKKGATKREALDAPYNSEADDFTPYVILGKLYLASNRGGGCDGYDLYAFPLEK
ncbi:MAG: PD40 domain-containing protein [Chlorobi bacterium]|nr:MAG: immunogenic 75 kDa protein PG4 [Chlorobi bacterium OLB7]MBK8912549.1 PD40 domain-containing protein [Chlorobiota bacterium]MCE7934266.1 hypothetical protein [Chlorobi bacterium CHB2]